MLCKGNKGQYILSDSAFKRGGEGSIYDIKNQPQYVAKIYHQNKLDSEKEKKIQFMVNNPPRQDVLTQIAWPLDIIYDSNNHFVGFIMPKLKKSENLNVIYAYGEGAKYSNLTWSKKIQIAKNICAVLVAVHEAGHVVGDLNPNNISVDPNTGFVTFFDADSFHITDSNGKIYRCNVGMANYLPYEIQEKLPIGLDKASLPTFTKNTDDFALGIHIFQLLMNGVHPYAGRPLPTEESVVAPLPDKNIISGVTPFFQTNTGLDIPLMAPKIDILPNYIRKLFTLCFINGHKNPNLRPTGEEWFHALAELQKELTTCEKNPSHQFYKELTKCPWCETDKRYNEALNGFVTKEQKIIVPIPPVSPKSSSIKPQSNTATNNTSNNTNSTYNYNYNRLSGLRKFGYSCLSVLSLFLGAIIGLFICMGFGGFTSSGFLGALLTFGGFLLLLVFLIFTIKKIFKQTHRSKGLIFLILLNGILSCIWILLHLLL